MRTTGHCSLILVLLVLTVLLVSAVSGQKLDLVPDSTAPLVQLTGEHFQLFAKGTYFTALTQSQTMSRYGALGADLGFPVVYQDKIVILFGDTMSTRSVRDGGSDKFVFLPEARGNDSIGYIPNVDLSQCHYITDVDQQIVQGNSKPHVSFGGCPELRLYRNPKAGPNDHAYMTTTISGLEHGDNLGAFGVPTGAVDHNGRMYVFYIVKNQETKPHFSLKSIVARSTQAPSSWSDKNPPAFSRLYTVSTHEEVDDPKNPPPEEGSGGKFMFNPPVAMTGDELRSTGMAKGLPPELKDAAKVVFVFASSFRYNRSNLYLAAFSADDIEGGLSKWFYFSGTSGGAVAWTHDERSATPLLPEEPNIGDHSVIWNRSLNRFVLMYGHIIARFGGSPWGPWGRPILAMPPRSAWSMKLAHHTSDDPIKRSVLPVFGPRLERVLPLGGDEEGIPYGPYLIDQSTKNGDGSVTLYYLMSTWNPYQVFLAKSSFAFEK